MLNVKGLFTAVKY